MATNFRILNFQNEMFKQIVELLKRLTKHVSQVQWSPMK